ncbi:MAG: hypothetical protein ACLFU8_10815 [Anaerolineales bacterium]
MHSKDSKHPPSHLFSLRLWQEDLGAGGTEWRGRLLHVLSGDTHHFREWNTLIELLLTMLEDQGRDGMLYKDVNLRNEEEAT